MTDLIALTGLGPGTYLYNFMTALGGDLPGFEEAMRALFADELERFKSLLAAWPDDVREHAIKLAQNPDASALNEA